LNIENIRLDRLAISREIPLAFHYQLADDFTSRPVAKPWLFKNVIARGETSAWIAPPGGMKSALMAELAIAADRGIDWHGFKSKARTGVAYFALERADLVRRRIVAHMQRLNLPDEDLVNIAVVPSLVDLMSPAIVPKVIATIESMSSVFGKGPSGVGLIILDTFAKAIAAGGGDEDKAKDQGRVFANLALIREDLKKYGGGGPHIAIVGHTGKDETRGARGSNAFYGDVDVLVTIGGGEIKTATVTKANDAPEGPLFSFKSIVHEFGTDEDGDPITVNIVSYEDVSSEVATKPSEPKLTPDQKVFYRLLYDAGREGLKLEAWNGAAKDVGIGIKRKAKLFELRKALEDKDMVYCSGEIWRIKH
jgi:hypothetical protein